MTDIRDYLKQKILVFDGAFGTYYQEELARISRKAGSIPKAGLPSDRTSASKQGGSFASDPISGFDPSMNTPCEMGNIDRPDLVKKIHKDYLFAGARAIKTNTFAAYSLNLKGKDEAEFVIQKGLSLARQAIFEWRKESGHVSEDVDPVYIFADLGPAPGDGPKQKASQYIEAADIFLKAGISCFLFETQRDSEGILEAVKYIRKENRDAFIAVTYGVLPDGYSTEGQFYMRLIQETLATGLVDLSGLNCVSNPGSMFRLLEKLPASIRPRLLAMPNAGYPVVRGFRSFFDGNPDYFQTSMQSILDLGLRAVGGCCGTSPAYIKKLSAICQGRKLKEVDYKSPGGSLTIPSIPGTIKNPPSSNNRLLTKLQNGEKVIAVELDSPKNADLSSFMEGARALKAAGVDTLTIADCPIAQARMDSTLLACKVKRELDLDVIPHMTCRDRNINATKALLLGGHAEGIRNVLIITGDPIPSAERDEVKTVYQFNSRKLMAFIDSLNQEIFAGDQFGIFGALNVNALNFTVELGRAREKMSQGCIGFLTQPVLTEEAMENLRLARQKLPDAYLLAGLIPVISERNGRFMDQEINGISVPEDMIRSYHGLDRAEGEALGQKYVNHIYARIQDLVDGVYLMTPFHRYQLMTRIVKDLRG